VVCPYCNEQSSQASHGCRQEIETVFFGESRMRQAFKLTCLKCKEEIRGRHHNCKNEPLPRYR
jgi:hypothetical protein